ncbi:MAG: type II secretion system secretin GspD, partial [Deltaproteobacteria bacterium]
MARKEVHQCMWLLSFVLVLIVSLALQVNAQPERGPSADARSNKTISMDFDQVDIKVFIKFISELTGKNFVVDEKVRGKVTVLSPSKISVEEAYKVFESVLEVNGFTTVPAGKVIKIVPSVEARQKSVELRRQPTFVPRPDDRIITQIMPLLFADSQEVRKLLAPLVSKQGVVIAYEPTDILIITDFQSNIQRLLNIVEEIDVEFQEATITVIPLDHASAESLAQKVSVLLESKQKTAKRRRAEPPLKIVPYERINVLIVLADRLNSQMIKGLVKTLDQPTPMGAGNIQVIYLENAQSEELAKVLSGLPAKAQVKGEQPIISTEVRIVADKATNSLVITAKPEEFQVLEPIIKQLDIPRKQVYVEAVFMEISTDTRISLGVNWSVAGRTNIPATDQSGIAFGSVNPVTPPSVVTEAGQLVLPGGLTAGVVAFPITIGNLTFNNLTALINASQTQNDFDILQAPQLMTLDNEEATVVVAENIPFSTRVDQGTAVTDRAIQSFEYRDVGVTLKITPQINEKRFVKLKIYEEVSRVISESVQSGDQIILAPTTVKRTAETNIEVKDGQTVVIAGLIGEDYTETTAKVPCLGDVPVLGWLFKAEDKTTDRKNLVIFLTSYIVASASEADEIYQQKSEVMEELRKKPGEQPAEAEEEPAEAEEVTEVE